MALNIGELVGYVKLEDQTDEGMSSAQANMKRGGGKLAGIAKAGGLAAGAAIAAGLAYGMTKAMDVGAGTDKLAAQLGLTEAESERIGGVAGALYADAYGESMEQVNDAVGAVMSSIDGMADASDKRLQDVTARALDFASAFEVDVTRAAQVAGQMVSTGLAKDAEAAFDLLTSASQQVPAAIREDLLDATDEYGPFFEQLGYSGEQAFGLLVEASEKGMYGLDKAGDAVKEFTIRATDMSSGTQEAYETIGLDAEKMADKILAGGDDAKRATDKIIDGLLSIESPSARAQAAVALFGTPIEDLGTSEIPTFLESMKGATGAMDDASGASERLGDTLNDNAKTKVEGFKRSLEMGLVNFLGDKVIPVMEDVWQLIEKHLGPVFEDVADWIDRKIVPALEDMHEWFTKSGGGVDQAKEALKDAEPFIDVVRAALSKVLPFVIDLAKKYLPVLAMQWRIVGKVLGAIGKIAIGLWNHFFQPMIQHILRGIGQMMQHWGSMLQTLGRVPGFEWAKRAGDKMVNAGRDAQGLAEKVRKIPNRKDVKVTISTPDLRALNDKLDWVARPRTTRLLVAREYAAAGREARGGPQQYAEGGVVSGPGTGTSDSILARLSDGEYVVPARRVKQYGVDMLDAIKAGRFARGGLVGSQPAMAGATSTTREVYRERTVVERQGPLIGSVQQQPGEDPDQLAERLWFKTRTRG